MDVPRFYTGQQLLSEGLLELSEEESRHAVGSRRLRPGDVVSLFDGKGAEARGVIVSARRKGLQVELQQVAYVSFQWPVLLTLAIAMPKGQRQDVLIIRQIRSLLYEEGFTIGGARQKLTGDEARTDLSQSQQIIRQVRSELEEILRVLRR